MPMSPRRPAVPRLGQSVQIQESGAATRPALRGIVIGAAVSLSTAIGASAQSLPVRGIHLMAPYPAEVPAAVELIEKDLAKEGVNTLVLEIGYRFRFARRPEVADDGALSREELERLAAACRGGGIRLIPLVNCLGHQSWAKVTNGLLRSHPELDETPGRYPQNEGIYCRSYCPRHPDLHAILFDVLDEIAEAAGADAFHVGMDEVFLIGEESCARCRGANKAELLAQEVKALHEHLTRSGKQMWMWGDRLLDGGATGLGEWEASTNGTFPAVNEIPRDVVINDWHYESSPGTAAHFAVLGFPVVPAPWRKADVALAQLDLVEALRRHATPPVAARAQGMLQTTWCGFAEFVKAYRLEDGANPRATEAATVFKALFAEMRKRGLAPQPPALPAP
jgi:hypothetical protein